jgi:transposase
MELFDQQLGEVQTEDGIRYILRRNPERASRIRQNRDSKLECLRQLAQKQNDYLKNHSRAKADVALRKVNELSEKLRLSGLVTINIANLEISVCFDSDALAEAQKLDGCYAIKTDLSKKAASKQTVHNRYKDLSYVERAFRTSKTVELEMRPIHVRLATRTRGHVFVVMLAYMIVQELSKRWSEIDITVSEGINELGKLCATEVRINNKPHCNKIPQPRVSARELLDAASVKLPEVLPSKDFKVASRKKLTKRRIRA